MREVLMNEKTNLLQLEEHFYQLVDVDEPNTLQILHSEMASSREHRTRRSRLLPFMIIYISLVALRE